MQKNSARSNVSSHLVKYGEDGGFQNNLESKLRVTNGDRNEFSGLDTSFKSIAHSNYNDQQQSPSRQELAEVATKEGAARRL